MTGAICGMGGVIIINPEVVFDMKKRNLELRKKAHDAYISSIQNCDRKKPNIILVFVDDMGYGDLSCFGSKAIKTPNIDRIAGKGVKLTNFYAASPVCSPSRFSCLTGRYPTRGFFNDVLFPQKTMFGRMFNRKRFPISMRGILPDEVTIPEALRAGGYRTGMFGKWHLGDESPYLPNDKGFDYFYGAHYSVDMEPYEIYRNKEVAVPRPVNKKNLTKMLTEEILAYLDGNKNEPFFIYYASPYPHHPAAASCNFAGKSAGGTYGDCVEELDWSIGKILDKLEEHDIFENTMVVFTSDNGPWFEGNPGYHRGRKGENFDGGHMVPFVACWPKEIPSGKTVETAAMNTDFFPTFLKMAGIPLPDDREIDGEDIMPLLAGETQENVHDAFYFITGDKVLAVRSHDDMKYMVQKNCSYQPYTHNSMGPFLFDLKCDPQESYDTANKNAEKAKELALLVKEANDRIQKNPRGWKKKRYDNSISDRKKRHGTSGRNLF
jgi:arylsulfatase A-like enzyme